MRLIQTELPDVLVIEPRIHQDSRGFFMQTWQSAEFADIGIEHRFVQDNQSYSVGGVLRGLHYQIGRPQGKLVRCLGGEIFDVAVDMRVSSAYFGRWTGVVLSSENHYSLWVPPGFAHGFYVLSDSANVAYKCTDFYAPDDQRTLLWSDPELNIQWPIAPGKAPLVSQKDAEGMCLIDAECYP